MVVPVHKTTIVGNKEIPSRDFSCSSFSVTSVPPCFKIFLAFLKTRRKRSWSRLASFEMCQTLQKRELGQLDQVFSSFDEMMD